MQFDLTEYKPNVSLEKIKDFVLDQGLRDSDAILLNPETFDELVINYRKQYKESIQIPFYLLGVLITEDHSKKLGLNVLGVIKDYHPSKNIRL